MNKKHSLVLAILLLVMLIPRVAGPCRAGEQTSAESRDFSISKIVLCDPDDVLCKPRLFFNTGSNIRINVLQNYSPAMVGSTREMKLFFYDPDHREIMKATKPEQIVWGPHINDRWLCFIPGSLDNGVYEITILVKVGQKEFQKTVSFSIKNSEAVPDDADDVKKQPEDGTVNEKPLDDSSDGKPGSTPQRLPGKKIR